MRAIVMILMFAVPGVVLGVEASSPQAIASKFFGIFVRGEGDAAIDYFMGQNRAFKTRGDQLKQLKTQLAKAIQLYGKPLGVETVSVEEITPSLQRHVYLTKHENHPLVWEMYFYKPYGTWVPDQIVFLDQYQLIGRKK